MTAMLRANEMVEREQRGDGNCMFRSLSVAAGKSPEYHEELRRRVVERMRAEANEEGASKVSKLGAWGNSEALKVAAEELQVRVNVITMDGHPGRPVEIQRVGEHGPVISVALYAQHMNALVKKQEKLRCSGRDVMAVRNNGILLVTGWRASKQQKPRMYREKAEWKQELRQTENAASVLDQLEPTAAAATGAVVTTVCMVAVATTSRGRAIRQKWDWGTLIAILMAFMMAAAMVAVAPITAMWKYQSASDTAGSGVSAAGVYTVGAGDWNSTGCREAKSALAFTNTKDNYKSALTNPVFLKKFRSIAGISNGKP